MAGPPDPPAIRRINVADVMRGNEAVIIVRPGDKVDVGLNFTDVLSAGYTGFSIGTVNYGAYTQGSAPYNGAPWVYIYVNTGAAPEGTSDRVLVPINYSDPNSVGLILSCAFTLVCQTT